eukprot:GHVL01018483.1.p1 GENE.GHVL01018483.1~~GHVL01018483.1.p1  ORF type:complete len:471 (+),score=135.96 GHVL01018483.1:1277-2689(+)
MTDDEVDLIERGVAWVAEHGWKFLPAYKFIEGTGEWEHRLYKNNRIWLSNNIYNKNVNKINKIYNFSVDDLINEAEDILSNLYFSGTISISSQDISKKYESVDHLRWFPFSSDVSNAIRTSVKCKEDMNKAIKLVVKNNGGKYDGREIWSPFKVRILKNKKKYYINEDTINNETGKIDNIADMINETENNNETDLNNETDMKLLYNNIIIPKSYRNLIGCAIRDYNMINNGDRLLIGLSGGKDSLTLLNLLISLKKKSPIKFDIYAATVDPLISEYNPSLLIEYMKILNIKYHVLKFPIIERAKIHMTQKQSICAYCARMKRGILYSCMRENNYNVLCLGQHLDDLAESFLMSTIHNGKLITMKANYVVEEGDLRVCRPLVYMRESQTEHFAKINKLPVITDNCPACFSAPKERHRMKLLLSQLQYDNPNVFSNILKAIKPLMAINDTNKKRTFCEVDEKAENVLSSCGV